jgi:hypothetical protein
LTLSVRRFGPDLGLTLLPRAENKLLHQPHAARCWL